MVERGLDQAGEQRVRLGRARLELRVSLGGHIERVHVLRQFHELGELAVRAAGRRMRQAAFAQTDPCRPR